MDTIIIPGFALKNKVWAEEIRDDLSPSFQAETVNWAHWETGKAEADWIEVEAERIITRIQGKQVNIIAKSIGTAVAMVILKSKPETVNKIVLCGIPIYDFSKGDEKYYEVLRTIRENKIFCIQNKDDNHGGYTEIEKFLHSINPMLNIISRDRSDHEYPYPDEFKDFLSR